MQKTESGFSLSSVYVSKTLFHPRLDYFVFPLVTEMPMCKGQTYLESCPGFGNQWRVLINRLNRLWPG